MTRSPGSELMALEALRWVGPTGAATYYLVSSTVAFCFLQKPGRNAGGKARRLVAVTLTATILVLYVCFRTIISEEWMLMKCR